MIEVVNRIKIKGVDEKDLGHFTRMPDGSFQWCPPGGPWCYDAESLREIAKGLDKWSTGKASDPTTTTEGR